jgi:Flp pilus assembly protein TadG
MAGYARPRRLFTAFTADTGGVAAVEFALFAMMFLILLAGTIDLGNVLFTEFELDSAVAAGAQAVAVNTAEVNSTQGASLASSIAATVANANGTGWASVTVVVNNGPSVSISNGSTSSSGSASAADSYYCLTGTPGNWSWGGAVTAGTTCSGSIQAGQFVTITAQRTVPSFFPKFGFVPSGAIVQAAVVETQ